MAEARRQHERCLLMLVDGIQFGTVIEQELGNVLVAVHACQMQHRPAILLLPFLVEFVIAYVDVSACFHQEVDHFHVAVGGGQHDGCLLAALHLTLDVFFTVSAIEEHLHNFYVRIAALLCRHHQGGAARLSLSEYVGLGLE
eukprot:scaffold19937_cov127-Isochrysis_galbana.AAC.4